MMKKEEEYNKTSVVNNDRCRYLGSVNGVLWPSYFPNRIEDTKSCKVRI